jgi:hypothetical protein
VNTVSLSPCGNVLVSGSDDLLVKLWDWQAGNETFSFASGHTDNVFQARLLPDSSNATLVSCAADGRVRVAHLSPGGGAPATALLGAHRGRAHKLALDPAAPSCFFSCGEDGEVRHFDLRQAPPGNRRLLVCRAFMVSTALAFIGPRPPTAALLCFVLCAVVPSTRCRVFTRVQGRPLELHSVATHPSCPQLCVGGSDEYARLYDLRRIHESPTAPAEPLRRVAPQHLRGDGARRNGVHITAAVFNRAGDILASYNDEHAYLLAGDRPKVRRAKGAASHHSGGKRLRSRDGSQQPGPAAARRCGDADAPVPPQANDAAWLQGAAPPPPGGEEEALAADDGLRGLIDTGSGGSSDGMPGLTAADMMAASPLSDQPAPAPAPAARRRNQDMPGASSVSFSSGGWWTKLAWQASRPPPPPTRPEAC